MLKEWESRVGHLKNARQEFSKRQRELESKLSRLRDLREDGSYSREEYLERKAKAENELLALKVSSSEAHIDQLDLEARLDEAEVFLTSLGTHWKNLSYRLQPRFQKLVYPEGIPYTKGVGFGTSKMGRIFELNQEFLLEESSLVRPPGFEPGTFSLRGSSSTN